MPPTANSVGEHTGVRTHWTAISPQSSRGGVEKSFCSRFLPPEAERMVALPVLGTVVGPTQFEIRV